jgi:transcriptional regulator with XRE-family HTH domain
VAITDGLEMHLGATDGVAIMFAFPEATGRPRDERDPVGTSRSAPIRAGDPAEATDPGLQRVGSAIAARRRELGFTQEEFAAEKILSVAPLIAIEKGRSWPHASTRAKLEAKLQWPAGTIDNIRSGLATPPSDETTHVINPDAQVSMLARTISVALKRIDGAVSALPAPSDHDFLPTAEGILADLNDLRGIAEDAAENHHTPVVELATTLLAIRRRIDDLLALTARSPQATLGRRLQVLRRQRGLNVDDIALMARLPADVVAQAEADVAISAEHHAALRALVDQIA